MVSNYCKECLKFRQKNCEGRSSVQETTTFFGSRIEKLDQSGSRFCNQYEFDYRLLEQGKSVETFKQIKQRQVVRDKTNADNEAMDDFDLAASLSSADFE